LLRLGGVAPRTAESGPECSRKLSHTSLSPSVWVSCAKSSAVQWLHALKVRQSFAAPVSRASFGTR